MSRHRSGWVDKEGKKHGGVTDIMPGGGLVIEKKAQKDLGGGTLGRTQLRKPKNIVKSPRLSKRLGCIAGKLAGKKPGTLGAAQDAFREAQAGC